MSRFNPDWIVRPSETLKETIYCLGFTYTMFSKLTGITTFELNQLLNDKIKITPDLAKKIAEYTKTDAKFWVNLSNNYFERLQ